jgi:Helix-turn-helix domain
MAKKSGDKMLTTAQAADILGVSSASIRVWLSEEGHPRFPNAQRFGHVWQIPESDLAGQPRGRKRGRPKGKKKALVGQRVFRSEDKARDVTSAGPGDSQYIVATPKKAKKGDGRG